MRSYYLNLFQQLRVTKKFGYKEAEHTSNSHFKSKTKPSKFDNQTHICPCSHRYNYNE